LFDGLCNIAASSSERWMWYEEEMAGRENFSVAEYMIVR